MTSITRWAMPVPRIPSVSTTIHSVPVPSASTSDSFAPQYHDVMANTSDAV